MSRSSDTSRNDIGAPTGEPRPSSQSPTPIKSDAASPSVSYPEPHGVALTRSSTEYLRQGEKTIPMSEEHEFQLLFGATDPHPIGYSCSCGALSNCLEL
jgi:hypothetical protein